MEAGCTTEAPPYTEEDLDADSVHLGQVSVCRLLSPFPPPSPTVKAPLASFVKSGFLGLKAVYTVKEPVMFGHRKAPKRHDTPRESPLYKREPPLQKRGLPLAAASLFGGRVPLGPREAVEESGTLGTVRDVRAPLGHDGAAGFEEVRALIGA